MGSEGKQSWVCRAVRGSLPSQRGSLRSSSGQRHRPCLGNAAPVPTESTSATLLGCPLPSAPHPHTLPKSLELGAEPSPALLCPDGARQAGVAGFSLSFCLHLDQPLPVLFTHFPHGKGPHKESRCSSQVGSPVSCSLKVSLFLQVLHPGHHTPTSSSGLLLCVWQH